MNGEYHFLVKLLDLSYPVFSSLVCALNNLENPLQKFQRLFILLKRNIAPKEIPPPRHSNHYYEFGHPGLIVGVQFASQAETDIGYLAYHRESPFLWLLWDSCDSRTGLSAFSKRVGSDFSWIDISAPEFFQTLWYELNSKQLIKMNGEYYFLVKLLDLSYPVFSSLVFALNNKENPAVLLEVLLYEVSKKEPLKELVSDYYMVNAFSALRISRVTYELTQYTNSNQARCTVEFAKEGIVSFRFTYLAENRRFYRTLTWDAPEKVGRSVFRKIYEYGPTIDICQTEFFRTIWGEINS